MDAGTRWAGKKEREDLETGDGLLFDDNCQEGVVDVGFAWVV